MFEDRLVTLEQLKAAMKDNWQSPDSAEIRRLCLAVPKFGNDDDEADGMVAEVFESYLQLLPGMKPSARAGDRRYRPMP